MKEFVKKNLDYIIIAVVSVIAFVIGCLAVNIWVAFLVIGLADITLFIPNLIKKRKQIEKSRHASTEKYGKRYYFFSYYYALQEF